MDDEHRGGGWDLPCFEGDECGDHGLKSEGRRRTWAMLGFASYFLLLALLGSRLANGIRWEELEPGTVAGTMRMEGGDACGSHRGIVGMKGDAG